MQSAVERRPTLLLVIVLGVLFIVMSNSSRTRRPDNDSTLFARTLMGVLSPVPRAVNGTSTFIGNIYSGYLDLRNASKENTELKRRLALLAAENVQLRGALGEVQRMRELLGYAESIRTPAIFGRVVMVDTSGPFKSIIIDRGSAHGVELNDPVVNVDGLIGRVILTTSDLSKVQLVIDSGSSVGVAFERTRRQAIARGSSSADLEVALVPSNTDVRQGDRIITAGIDGVYPRGIVVGTVSRVSEGTDLFAAIASTPSVDFATLEDVIVLDTPKLDPEVTRYAP